MGIDILRGWLRWSFGCVDRSLYTAKINGGEAGFEFHSVIQGASQGVERA
jgi:hypothetical protein